LLQSLLVAEITCIIISNSTLNSTQFSLTHAQLCTLSESCVLTPSRHGRRLATDDLPICRHRQVGILCLQRLVGICKYTSDLQRLVAFIRRSDRCSFVPANLPTFADLCENADEKLFKPSPATATMFYTTSFPLSLKDLNTTTCSNVHTTSHCPLELVISLTRTTFNACCT